MTNLSEPSPDDLDMLATVERNTARLLPLLSLLKADEDGPDRVGQLMELLRLLLDMQQRQASVLKSVADKIDRLSRR